ncbi:MAG: hypothetical protein R3261_15380, partial [Alphaproteobacteria bacterium]|nr:hypothetical protein [Alphaproteobacteria bacterium]
TVTAILNHVGYEITSLRIDEETDGRHAQVSFTKEWQQDALRRDFTMNALYMDLQGQVYDYFDGLLHLKQKKVAFVGDARARLEEDRLRLLRYFRFVARFSDGKCEPDLLHICADFVKEIPKLASERIWQEWRKILVGPHLASIVRHMQDISVFDYLYGINNVTISLSDIDRIEGDGFQESIVALAALHWSEDYEKIPKIAKSLRLSGKERTRLENMFKNRSDLLLSEVESDDFYASYLTLGQEAVLDVLAIEMRNNPDQMRMQKIEKIKAFATEIGDPVFTLLGRDLALVGVPPGPAMGQLLSYAREAWIKSGFKLSKSDCLDEVQKVMDNPDYKG